MSYDYDEYGEEVYFDRTFKGGCIGVALSERGKDDPHVMINVLVGDDTNWFTKACVSSFWLDEMIEMLETAREHLKKHQEPDPDGYGYQFKKGKQK